MAYDTRALRGIGGWLAFFILTLTVFGPIGSVTQTMSDLYGNPAIADFYGANWGLLQAIELTVMAATIAASLFMGWRLYAVHNWQSVRIAIAGMWIAPLVGMLIDAAAVALVAGLPLGPLLSQLGGELFRPAVYAAIWTAYLLRSERVANTYERYPETYEEAAIAPSDIRFPSSPDLLDRYDPRGSADPRLRGSEGFPRK